MLGHLYSFICGFRLFGDLAYSPLEVDLTWLSAMAYVEVVDATVWVRFVMLPSGSMTLCTREESVGLLPLPLSCTGCFGVIY